jgi:hypothetical protein
MDPFLHEVEGIRRFNDETIQKHIDNVLNAIPQEKHGAVLNVDFGPFGVRGVLAARLEKGWSIGLVGAYKNKKDWGAGVRAVKVFDW